MSTQGDQRSVRQRIEGPLSHQGHIQVYVVTVRTGPECDPEVYWIDASSEQRACARAIKYAGGGSAARIAEVTRFKMVEEADEHLE